MALESQKSWPEPPQRIAKDWPDGFPDDGSEEFRHYVYGRALRCMQYIAGQLERELSTIDRYHIRILTEEWLRRYFSGDYGVDIYSDVYY